MAQYSLRHFNHRSLFSTLLLPLESPLLLRVWLGMDLRQSKSLICWPPKHRTVTSECGVFPNPRIVVMLPV